MYRPSKPAYGAARPFRSSPMASQAAYRGSRPTPPQFQSRRTPGKMRQTKIAGLIMVAAIAFGYGAYTILGANALTLPTNKPGGSAVATSNSAEFFSKVCADDVKVTKTGTLRDGRLNRVSGIAAARAQAGYYWTHNDAGDSARIFSIKRDGSVAGTFNLPDVAAADWEDIDIGPGPVSGRNYIYIADTGDNKLNRKSVTIYRVAEPSPDLRGGSISFNQGSVETLTFIYPDGAHDVEAIFIDQKTGEIYAIDKSDKRAANVYRAPGGLQNGSNTLFTKVSNVGFKSGKAYEPITSADMSPNNLMIAVRSYDSVAVFDHQNDAAVADSFAATNSCLLPDYKESRSEAVSFQANNNGLVTASEGKNQPLYSIDPR